MAVILKHRSMRREALELATLHPGIRGICSQCGCTDDNACLVDDIPGGRWCGWSNADHTLCDNVDCVAADKRAKKGGR